jgi:hypothetical protein
MIIITLFFNKSSWLKKGDIFMFDFNLRKDYKQDTTQSVQDNAQSPRKELLQAKTVEINGYKFIISKMPCTVAQEVIFKLPTGLIPLISQFSQSEEMALKMLSYCERVYADGQSNVRLISKALVDNHVPDFDTLIKLENECLQFNFDFFAQGKVLDFLNKGLSLAESKASGILTDLLDKLLSAGVQRFTSSEQSTR